jgi:hypothetical protein
MHWRNYDVFDAKYLPLYNFITNNDKGARAYEPRLASRALRLVGVDATWLGGSSMWNSLLSEMGWSAKLACLPAEDLRGLRMDGLRCEEFMMPP